VNAILKKVRFLSHYRFCSEWIDKKSFFFFWWSYSALADFWFAVLIFFDALILYVFHRFFPNFTHINYWNECRRDETHIELDVRSWETTLAVRTVHLWCWQDHPRFQSSLLTSAWTMISTKWHLVFVLWMIWDFDTLNVVVTWKCLNSTTSFNTHRLSWKLHIYLRVLVSFHMSLSLDVTSMHIFYIYMYIYIYGGMCHLSHEIMWLRAIWTCAKLDIIDIAKSHTVITSKT